MSMMDVRASIHRLQRRLDYLEGWIKKHPDAPSIGYDKSERKALQTAIGCMEVMLSYGYTVINDHGHPLFHGQYNKIKSHRMEDKDPNGRIQEQS